MKFKDGLILALLGAGCPLLLFGSMLSASVSCQVDQQQGVVFPVGRKSDAYMLLVLVGVAQGAAAAWLGRGYLKREAEEEAPTLAAVPQRPGLPLSRSPLSFGEAELSPIGDTYQPIAVTTHPPVDAVEVPQQRPGLAPEFAWVKDLLGYPCILIWGAQGSGKTSFAAWLIRQRRNKGHRIKIWDPHREYGQWNGLPCTGDGMDYEALDGEMELFAKGVKQAYESRANDPNFKPAKATVLAEELTNWADRCKNSADFFKCALSDIRKIGLHVVFVAHDRTLTTLGGAKGVSKARDAGMVELELMARVDPQTGEAVPAMKGRLKYPGREPVEVAIAPWMKGDMDFTDGQHIAPAPKPSPAPAPVPHQLSEQEIIRAKLEGLISDSPSFTRPDSFPETAPDETDSETTGTTEPQDFEPMPFTPETFLERFPETTETEFFTLIQEGYENGFSPSDIVKRSLKLGKTYQLGKAVCVYLVRKYGDVGLLLHFKNWIEG